MSSSAAAAAAATPAAAAAAAAGPGAAAAVPDPSGNDAGFARTEMARVLPLKRAPFEEFLKRRFFWVGSFEIYGGVKGLYDYGPPGCAIKNNLLQAWRQHFVLEEAMQEIDASCLTPFRVLEASGHVAKFQDLLVKDAVTGDAHRADHVLEGHLDKLIDDKKTDAAQREQLIKARALVGDMKDDDIAQALKHYNCVAPETGNALGVPYPFNLMFATQIGPTGAYPGFLRPETAQGIFVNFQRLLSANGERLPFGAAQIGLAFRNEIAPRSGLLRVREFTMAEIEWFFRKQEPTYHKFASVADVVLPLFGRAAQGSDGMLVHVSARDAVERGIIFNETLAYFLARTKLFLLAMGAHPDKIRFRQHLASEMAHYAKDCWDAEMLSSYGWIECAGHAYRCAYDLKAHSKSTGQRLKAYETFKEPQTVEVLQVKAQKAVIGKEFKGKGDSKLVITYLEALEDDAAKSLQSALDSAESTTVTIEERPFTIQKSMVTFGRVTKKINGKNFTPHVIEPSFGIGRVIYCLLEQAYDCRANDEQRNFLRLSPLIAPFKCAVLPVVNSATNSALIARISSLLTAANLSSKADDSSTKLGRKYARVDELGVPFAVTIDERTATDDTVTLRERDSCKQVRVSIGQLPALLADLVALRKTWADVEAAFESVAPAAAE